MKFLKYEGLGNDFIIIEKDISKEQVIKLCDRKFGIGADGLIVYKKKNNIPYMHFYNADGSFASMCGNGIRCYADYLYSKGEDFSKIDTLSGIKEIEKIGNDYKVFMGKAKIDFEDYEYADILLNSIYTGTEHCVIIDKEKDLTFLKEHALTISKNKELFPIGTNVNLINVLDRENINMLTYERGVGITLACGTGACASAYIANKKGLVNENVNIHLLGGTLKIEIKEDGIYMIGPARKVFEGEIYEY